MRKALFFDIDGTLVNFRGRMPDSAKRALEQVQRNGHLIVICSGRSACQIYPWLLGIGFDGIIAATGAYVECAQQIVYEHYMDKESILETCALLDEAHAAYAAQAKSGLVVNENCRQRIANRFLAKSADKAMTDQLIANMQVAERLETRPDIQKFNFFESQIPLNEIRTRLANWCDVTDLSFGRRTDEDGEISFRGVNKALGIQKFIEYAGIAREDTAAFGDGANDLDMLEYAQVGVAMGNAIDDLKERANFVTRDIDDDGIAYALKELGLL